MMTDAEERAALDALVAQPPQWLLYVRIEPKEYLRIFPSADPGRVLYPSIEKWILQGYASAGLPPVGGYPLLRRTARDTAAGTEF
jgi:hypothetical protein